MELTSRSAMLYLELLGPFAKFLERITHTLQAQNNKLAIMVVVTANNNLTVRLSLQYNIGKDPALCY